MTLSLDTAYRSFGGEVEASSTPTICRLPDSRCHQLSAIAPVSPETPTATVSAGESASSLKTPPENVPPETPTALSSAARAEPVHDMTERLEICFQEARAADVACIDPANDTVKRAACLQSARAAQVQCLENLSHEPPTGRAQNQPADTAWVVSETTSPVDYSPLITA